MSHQLGEKDQYYYGNGEKDMSVVGAQPVDLEAGGEPVGKSDETVRALKPRQISMIAIGGAIGTGLVIGSGTSLARSGPGSVFVAYCIMGMVCFGVLCSLGEMSAKYPTKKGFAGHATRFVDPALGYATGIVYLCKYLILSPTQITAGALVIGFWDASITRAAWVIILIVFVLSVQFLGIKWFGELEFWLSFIKILTLTGLILVGLIIDLGGVPGQERIGFRYWKNGKAFRPWKTTGDTGRFVGFFNALVQALFAYMGTELIGVTVGEAKNPRKTIPSAIRKTFYRILFFYITLILIVGMIVDSTGDALQAANKKGTKGGAAASPFVIAIQAAKIKVLPSILNACILIFTISAANSDQYIASRTLYGLAMDGHAPRIFKKCTSRGVPITAFAFTALFMALAFLVVTDDGLKVFNYFSSSVSICGSLAWTSILASHIAMMKAYKAQGVSRDTLPYKAPFQPGFAYVCLFFSVLISIFKGFDAFFKPFDYKSFITNYIAIPVYVFGYIGYKFMYRTPWIRPMDADLSKGAREFADIDEDAEDAEEAEYKQMSFKQKLVWQIKNW